MNLLEKVDATLGEIKQILLGSAKEEKQNFAHEAELTDGSTIVTDADEFAPGVMVWVRTEDGQAPLPVGEYPLADGSVLVVEEEGMVAAINAESAPEEETEAAEEEEAEMSAEESSEPQVETPAGNFDKEALMDAISGVLAEFKTAFAEMQKQNEELNEKFSKLENTPDGEVVNHAPSDRKKSSGAKVDFKKMTPKQRAAHMLQNR